MDRHDGDGGTHHAGKGEAMEGHSNLDQPSTLLGNWAHRRSAMNCALPCRYSARLSLTQATSCASIGLLGPASSPMAQPPPAQLPWKDPQLLLLSAAQAASPDSAMLVQQGRTHGTASLESRLAVELMSLLSLS